MSADLKDDIRGIWMNVLGTDAVSDETDFFVAGGDSALAMSLLLSIEERVELMLEPSTLYEHPVFADFVGAVQTALSIQTSEFL